MSQPLEIVRNAGAVNLGSTDFSTADVAMSGILFAVTSGNIAVQWASGQTTTFAVTAGSFLRVWPKKILKTGTTATVQVMTL
jgi:hypothetical protein